MPVIRAPRNSWYSLREYEFGVTCASAPGTRFADLDALCWLNDTASNCAVVYQLGRPTTMYRLASWPRDPMLDYVISPGCPVYDACCVVRMAAVLGGDLVAVGEQLACLVKEYGDACT